MFPFFSPQNLQVCSANRIPYNIQESPIHIQSIPLSLRNEHNSCRHGVLPWERIPDAIWLLIVGSWCGWIGSVRLAVISFQRRFAVFTCSTPDVVAPFLNFPQIGTNSRRIVACFEHQARSVWVIVVWAGRHTALHARRTRRSRQRHTRVARVFVVTHGLARLDCVFLPRLISRLTVGTFSRILRYEFVVYLSGHWGL